jgi:type I restriction enzyme S subunit
VKDHAKPEWEVLPLGKVAELINGRAYKKAELLDEGPYRVLRVGNFFTNRHWYYSDLELPPKNYCEQGDLLYAWSASFGPRIWTGERCIFHYHIWKVDYDEDRVLRDFLYYFFDWDKDRIREEQGAGATMIHVSKRSMEQRAVPLPPLEEQQRIVAVLDEAFEGLARARAHAEANLQNARELFENWAANVFELDGEKGASFNSLTIRDVCTIQSGAGFPKKHQGNSDGEYPFYKVSDMNLEGNEWELFKAVNYVSDDIRSELGARVFPIGSIVFPKVGGAILTNKKRVVGVAGCVDNNVMGLIPDPNAIVPEYLHEWLRAAYIYEFSNKANPPSITQATVSSWPIKVPDRNQQERVVEEAVHLRARTNNLLEVYSAALHDLEDLRQSLLQKAFSGELT